MIYIAYNYTDIEGVDCLSIKMIGTEQIIVENFAKKWNYYTTELDDCQEYPDI
jgi:hypothetical protein